MCLFFSSESVNFILKMILANLCARHASLHAIDAVLRIVFIAKNFGWRLIDSLRSGGLGQSVVYPVLSFLQWF